MKIFLQLVFCFSSLFLLSSCSSYCDDVDCGPNGTCNNETEQCDCDAYYEGDNCEREIRERFLGTWTAISTSNPNATPFEVAITDGPTVDAVLIQTEGLLQNWIVVGSLDEDNNVNIPDFLTNFTTNVYSGTIVRIDENTLDYSLTSVLANGDVFTGVYQLSK